MTVTLIVIVIIITLVVVTIMSTLLGIMTRFVFVVIGVLQLDEPKPKA